jgi:hypothetical protein
MRLRCGRGHERTSFGRWHRPAQAARGALQDRLKLQVSAGVLIAIVSGSHVLSGLMDGDIASKGISLFGLAAGLYIAGHYSVLLKMKSAIKR